MYPWLDDAIERGATVITASRRLARELESAYAERKAASGAMSWLTPPIHSLDDWCRLQYDLQAESHEIPQLVDDSAAAILWERCLRRQLADGVPAFRGVLRLALETWRRVSEWKVPLDEVARTARSADEQVFSAAAAEYQELLNSGGWIDGRGVSHLLATLVAEKRLVIPQNILLAGFDRPTPALSELTAAMQAAGCEVSTAPQHDARGAVGIASYEDPDAELRAAGAWARNILADDSTAKVAVVSPALSEDSDRAARLVREGLAPGWQYGSDAHRNAVNVSYGRKLAEYPAIAVALSLLEWLHRDLPTRDVSLLLRSGCLAGASTAGRSRLELVLRSLPDRPWSADELQRGLAGRDDSADARNWLRGLDVLIAMQKDADSTADPAHWASRFDSLLNAWGWPGESTLSSFDFQLVNRWRKLLNELAGTALVHPQQRLTEAIERLRALADDIVFQPEADASLVSLLGTLEAAGMQFDHLWVCGLHAGRWPPSGKPSPMLSRALQKEYGMPDATPADTLAFARRVLQRMVTAAPDVVLSWPSSDGESQLTPSSLLDGFGGTSLSAIEDPRWHAIEFTASDNLRKTNDDPPPTVAADEEVRGGARIVQQQATEPFAAFVYGRLGVRRADAIEAGITAKVRGNLVHDALHNLFSDLPAQAQICNWSSEELERRIGSAVDAALAVPMRHADRTYSRLLGLERRRTVALLQSFIAAECNREAFSIAGVEQCIDFESCGVRLALRVDRIDRLADDTLLIIDYKTGAPKNLLDRDGEPTDLQLVVYAAALDQAIGGLAFVNLDSRTISYKGTGDSVEWGGRQSDSWQERLRSWKDQVEALLEEFAAGDVRVNLAFRTGEARTLALLSRIEETRRDQ